MVGEITRYYHSSASKLITPVVYIGIDGEGTTEHHGPWPGKHRYTMLCAADEYGRRYSVENENGLSTIECLEFILSLPSAKGKIQSKVFAYSFGYDLTKILEDVDDCTLYKLVRPELRRGMRGKQKIITPLFWPIDNPQYSFNWMNGRFAVKKLEGMVANIDPLTGEISKSYQWGPP